MVQLGKKMIEFNQDKSEDLFDAQSILDSMPYGVAIFDAKLILTRWNDVFLRLLNIKNKLLVKKPSLHDALCATSNNITPETEETINTIVEMYNETQSDKPFKWIYKFNLDDEQKIDINVEFYPKQGLVLSLLNIKTHNDHQLVEF